MKMDLINQSASLDDFFGDFKVKKSRILFLDYDGTLSPFVESRDQAFPYPGIIERIEELTASSTTKLFIITGRTIADLKAVLKLDKYPALIGSHGVEKLEKGSAKIESSISNMAEKALFEIKEWGEEIGLCQFAEIKLSGIAFHWRGLNAEKKDEIKKRVFEKWKDSAPKSDLEMHEFDGGLELRYSKMNKGKAIKPIFEQFNSKALMAYLGDDQTDEDAFEAIGNWGLKVLVRNELRNTRADLRISPPDELLEFLDRWIAADK